MSGAAARSAALGHSSPVPVPLDAVRRGAR